ncbi:MAG: hypothetical protein WA718_07680 [Terriglobales bacterium]
MDKMKKWLEVAANVAIICVCVLIAVVGVKRYLLPGPVSAFSTPSKGTRLSVPGFDWSRSNRTLVMVLSTQCHFCSESAEFYKKLLPEATLRGTQVVAVLPQSPEESRQYFANLGLPTSNVTIQQEGATGIHVSGTPTLILADNKGSVIRAWAGKLAPGGETEVLGEIH